MIALIAPRPVYIASASEDLWADPKGEFLSLLHAEQAYMLYHDRPLGVAGHPKPGSRVGTLMGYHLRKGKHDITAQDWAHYLDFADRWLKEEVKGPTSGFRRPLRGLVFFLPRSC